MLYSLCDGLRQDANLVDCDMIEYAVDSSSRDDVLQTLPCKIITT